MSHEHLRPVARVRDSAGWARGAVGERPEFLWVKVADLRIDPAYQRDILKTGAALIRRMVAGWDWRLVQALTVAELPDGLWELIDGQHRAVAAATHGAIALLPAMRVQAADRAQRARAFVALNRARVAVTPGQRARAALAAGEADMAALMEIAGRAGARVLWNPPSFGKFLPGHCLAVGALRAEAAARPAALEVALRAAVAAGCAPIRGDHVATATEVAARGAKIETLARALRDWERLSDAAALAALDAGLTRRQALVAELSRRAL